MMALFFNSSFIGGVFDKLDHYMEQSGPWTLGSPGTCIHQTLLIGPIMHYCLLAKALYVDDSIHRR